MGIFHGILHQLTGLENVVGVIRHRRAQLFHAGGRLGQGRSLLLGTGGQVDIAGGNFLRRMRHGVAGIAHLRNGGEQRLAHLLHRGHQVIDFIPGITLDRYRYVQLPGRNLATVLARQVHRRKDHAFHQQADGEDHHHEQHRNAGDNNQTRHEIMTRILVQRFGVLLVNGENLIEHNFILAIELRHHGNKSVEPRHIVSGGSGDERRQSLVTVVLPRLLVGSDQRGFVRQTRRGHKRRKCTIGFGQRLFNRGQFRRRVGSVPRFHHFHILHNPDAQGSAVVNGINNGQNHLNFFVHIIQRSITFNDEPNAGDSAGHKEEKQGKQDNQG